MSTRPRRVTVTAPPERGTPVARARTGPVLEPGASERARRLRRAQLRVAAVTLSCAAALLFGLPLLLRVAPGLAEWRALGLPLGWIAVAWLPYPLLGAMAWWHLRRAEHAETEPVGDP